MLLMLSRFRSDGLSGCVFFAILSLASVAGVNASAETILSYSLAGIPVTAVESVTPNFVTPGTFGIDLTRGSGVTAAGLTNGYSAGGWQMGSSLNNAINGNQYFQFGLSIESGLSDRLPR
jgi:hypothetical protein